MKKLHKELDMNQHYINEFEKIEKKLQGGSYLVISTYYKPTRYLLQFFVQRERDISHMTSAR